MTLKLCCYLLTLCPRWDSTLTFISRHFTMDLLLLATSWSHVLLAPYTKVEESFNLHATHDILMYGVDKHNLYKA
jgi:hypothetical protein